MKQQNVRNNERDAMNSINYNARALMRERSIELPRNRSSSYNRDDRHRDERYQALRTDRVPERAQTTRTRSPSYNRDDRHCDERYQVLRTDRVPERSQTTSIRSPSYYRDDRSHRRSRHAYHQNVHTHDQLHTSLQYAQPQQNTNLHYAQLQQNTNLQYAQPQQNTSLQHAQPQQNTNLQYAQPQQNSSLQHAQALAFLAHNDTLQSLTRGSIGGNYYR